MGYFVEQRKEETLYEQSDKLYIIAKHESSSTQVFSTNKVIKTQKCDVIQKLIRIGLAGI